MNKPLHYATLVLETWPKIRDILHLADGAPRTADVMAPFMEALLAICKELDKVESDKVLAKDALIRVEALAHGFGNDPFIEALISKKFPS
jgi:hypothetical protein